MRLELCSFCVILLLNRAVCLAKDDSSSTFSHLFVHDVSLCYLDCMEVLLLLLLLLWFVLVCLLACLFCTAHFWLFTVDHRRSPQVCHAGGLALLCLYTTLFFSFSFYETVYYI
eukprot:Rmarinus@m.26958